MISYLGMACQPPAPADGLVQLAAAARVTGMPIPDTTRAVKFVYILAVLGNLPPVCHHGADQVCLDR